MARAGDAKAAYEAVVAQLRTPLLTAAVDTFELPYRVALRLRVDTMPSVLAWPLAVHEVDRLAVAYTHSPGVVLVPAMSVRIENTSAWRKTLTRVDPIVRQVLSPTSPFKLALAHVALDAAGSSACLTPASRPPHTIGTVVISLPTFHRGGNVTFAGGRHRSFCTQHATTTHVCAVFAPDANYLIAPLIHGQRVSVVYHVVASDGPAQTTIQAATATLQSLAAAPSHTLNVFALRPTAPTSRGVEGLAPGDRAFADALVETDVYDVALINKVQPEGARGPENIGRKVSTTTVAVRLPNCESRCNVTVDAILFTDARVDVRCMPGQWLIFWRKGFRVQLANRASVVETLVAAIAPGAVHSLETLLGQADLRSLVQALLHRPPNASMDISQSVELTNVLSETLFYLYDRALVAHFMRQHWSPVDVLHTAPWLPRFCAAFGWEYLGPAFLCMLRRWCATSLGSSASYALVVSLAGVSHEPICDPVVQPFVAELYLDARVLLLDVVARRDVEDDSLGANCTRVLQLEAYAQQHVVRGRWLRHRLPDAIVALISSFLKPRESMLRLVERKLYDPLYDVGAALFAVQAQKLALNDYWYAAVVVQSFLGGEYDYDDVRYNVHTVMGLIVAGARTEHLDAVLRQCVIDRELVVVPALVAVANQCPALLTPAFCAMASAVILDTTVRNESALPSMDAILRAYFEPLPQHRGHGPRTSVVASAFAFFRTHDAGHLSDFTDKWLAARPSATRLYDVIVLVQSTLGLEANKLLARLGQAYLDATAYRDSVVYTDYCLDAIAVPEACCTNCGDFGHFLLAPLKVEHRFCLEHLCASIAEIVSAHPLQLRTLKHSVLELDDVTMWGNAIGYTTAAPTLIVDIIKVRQPGQLLPSELGMRLKQSKTTSTSTVYRRGVVEELMKTAMASEETSGTTLG
ncbi:hypothetical protein SPRG_00305 [Saprolegnia parasitica CBS 223.65]|uniref:Uncharacterized protein n=1 Tax=Saprolegnia parasitica (strain CBS 223.65) TaxID=695850 RepID=A0A067CY64_SAPPC|nr:hypothetical protein SPRG_00305 [Saprolegnia parasitica CBS 223.65]KDO35458.1 hypothetical protein SPRG_00305 [Saprolegnia parasitica CBS 223.65]|eukprot:XP_012193797.1 hypothetical protein SPRG_00305 [Saprolegnia parasitica CBS 223.65]